MPDAGKLLPVILVNYRKRERPVLHSEEAGLQRDNYRCSQRVSEKDGGRHAFSFLTSSSASHGQPCPALTPACVKAA